MLSRPSMIGQAREDEGVALPARPAHGHNRFARGQRAGGILLAGIIALGIGLRAWAMASANWMIDGDEATFGLMAKHIIEGERPIFLYGQPYMGAFQAYLGAASFILFGMSRAAFKLVTLLEFAAFAVSIYLLARRTYGTRTALLATLFAAIPPAYVMSGTARLWGPLLDAMTLGNLILVLAIDEVFTERPSGRRWLRFLAMGVLGGFGFWLHGQIVIYLITAGVLLFLHDKGVVLRPRVLAAAGGFVIGAAPVFNFAFDHEYTTFHHLLGIGAEEVERDYLAAAQYYLRFVVPRVAGIANPWTGSPWWHKLPLALILGGAILSLARYRWRALSGWLRLSLRHGHPRDALILFAIILSAAFVGSNFGNLALHLPNTDVTGRYALPLVSVLPIILAGELLRLGQWRPAVATMLITIQLALTLTGYLRTPPTEMWQSPYWRHLPSSNAALIAVLDDMGADAVWINHWAGKPLMFDTAERISAADYYDLAVGRGIDRLPAATRRVQAAELPAFVIVTDDPNVGLEGWLQSQAIPYDKQVVPHYVVIRPLRKVDPAEVVDLLGVDR